MKSSANAQPSVPFAAPKQVNAQLVPSGDFSTAAILLQQAPWPLTLRFRRRAPTLLEVETWLQEPGPAGDLVGGSSSAVDGMGRGRRCCQLHLSFDRRCTCTLPVSAGWRPFLS